MFKLNDILGLNSTLPAPLCLVVISCRIKGVLMDVLTNSLLGLILDSFRSLSLIVRSQP